MLAEIVNSLSPVGWLVFALFVVVPVGGIIFDSGKRRERDPLDEWRR